MTQNVVPPVSSFRGIDAKFEGFVGATTHCRRLDSRSLGAASAFEESTRASFGEETGGGSVRPSPGCACSAEAGVHEQGSGAGSAQTRSGPSNAEQNRKRFP